MGAYLKLIDLYHTGEWCSAAALCPPAEKPSSVLLQLIPLVPRHALGFPLEERDIRHQAEGFMKTKLQLNERCAGHGRLLPASVSTALVKFLLTLTCTIGLNILHTNPLAHFCSPRYVMHCYFLSNRFSKSALMSPFSVVIALIWATAQSPETLSCSRPACTYILCQ